MYTIEKKYKIFTFSFFYFLFFNLVKSLFMQELLLLSAYVYLSKLCQGEWNRKNHAGIFRGFEGKLLKRVGWEKYFKWEPWQEGVNQISKRGWDFKVSRKTVRNLQINLTQTWHQIFLLKFLKDFYLMLTNSVKRTI